MGGVPPWDKVRPELFPQAFETTLAERAAEYRKIADNPAKPTFANTIVPMQLAGKRYGQVMTLFGVMTGNMNTPAYQKLDREWSPKFSAASDAITFDKPLFARIQAIYARRNSSGLERAADPARDADLRQLCAPGRQADRRAEGAAFAV